VDHAGAISTTRVCLKSAEPVYEPSGPRPLGKTPGVDCTRRLAGGGRAQSPGVAQRPTDAQSSRADISKWQKQ